MTYYLTVSESLGLTLEGLSQFDPERRIELRVERGLRLQYGKMAPAIKAVLAKRPLASGYCSAVKPENWGFQIIQG